MPAAEKQQAPSDAWNPAIGDRLEGVVTDVDAGWSDFANDYYPIVKVRAEGTGELVTVHAFHFKLAERLKLYRPKAGEQIVITYDGETPTKDGKRTVNLYTVDQPGKDVTDAIWDRIDPAAASKPAGGPAGGDDTPF